MPDDAPAKSSRSSHSWTYWILWACFIVFIIYPLSTGPVGMLIDKGLISGDGLLVIYMIYTPVYLLYNNSETAQHFFDWYTKLWAI